MTAGTGERARLKRFQVGEQFLESAKRNGFGTRMNVIDSCARILLDVPKNYIESFRVGADSYKQRFRGDGAGTFRTHLTKDGPGYRLMFWQLKDGSLRFANVGPKPEAPHPMVRLVRSSGYGATAMFAGSNECGRLESEWH